MSFAQETESSYLHAHRLVLRKKTMREAVIIAVASIACALTLVPVSDEGQSLWLLGPIAGFILIVWRMIRMQNAWDSFFVSTTIPLLSKALDDVDYQHRKIDAAIIAPFERLGLVGTSTDKRLEHLMRGRHRGIRFELVFAALSRRSRGGKNSGGSSGVFHGLLCRIETKETIPIHVAIQPRPFGVIAAMGSLFENPITAKLTEISVGPGEFSEKFEVRAALRSDADIDLVRNLISPSRQRALYEINSQEGAHVGNRAAFNAAFLDHEFYLALSRYGKSTIVGVQFERVRPLLDAGLYIVGDEADLKKRLLAAVSDFQIAHRIIDRLRGSNIDPS